MADNIEASEAEIIRAIEVWINHGHYPLEHMSLVKLGEPFEGDFVPGIYDQVTGNFLIINDKKQYSRASAMSKLGELWEAAEQQTN
jgi:hypothetical protein